MTQQDSLSKTRLTLASNSHRHVSLTANSPTTSQTSQQARSMYRPLPKPVKPPKPPKEKLSSHQVKLKKFREKKELQAKGPLQEAEDGEYNSAGLWVEKPKPEDPMPEQLEVPKEKVTEKDESRVRGTQPSQYDDPEAAIRQVQYQLEAMPSSQPFEDLFSTDQNCGRATRTSNIIPPASTASYRDKVVEWDKGLHLADAFSKLKGTRLPISAMRGGGKEDTPEDDMEDVPRPRSPSPAMPRSAQPRPITRSDFNEINLRQYDSDVDEVPLSPTERNSSCVIDPVPRAKTRRSNDRARVYSLEPSQHCKQGLSTGFEDDTPAVVGMSPPPPPSFAVSETEPPTQGATRFTSAPTVRLQRVKTYAKGAKSAPTRPVRQVARDPADRREFRDQFSPEPEWEQEHQVGGTARSKRAQSATVTPPLVEATQMDDEDDDWQQGLDGENQNEARLILGELQVNEKGQRVARGRGRNGEWPQDRALGLFHEETGDEEHPRPVELFRPVSERFHLARPYQEYPPMDIKYSPFSDIDIKPDISFKRRNPRANHDHPVVHPDARLKMSRSRSTAERVDVYISNVNANARQSRHPIIPAYAGRPHLDTKTQTKLKTTRKRRSKYDIPILPVSVLKPIKTVPADEYKRLLKTRVPGDGFINPYLVKAGRIGTRDAILQEQHPQQSRSRATGRSRPQGFMDRYPLEGQDDTDPVLTPTQDPDSRAPSDNKAGFGARQLARVRTTTEKFSKLRPKLPFTSRSPPHLSTGTGTTDDRDHHFNGMRFTTKSPPRTSDDRHTPDWQEGSRQEDNTAQPAPDVPGLIQPAVRLGFAARINKRKVDFEEYVKTGADRAQIRPGRGFIRSRPGFHSPQPPEAGWLQGGEQDHRQSPPGFPIANDHFDVSPHHDPSHPRQQAEQPDQQEPLFLDHSTGMDQEEDEDRDLDSNPSQNHRGAEHRTTSTSDTTANDGISGARLCDDLLRNSALLNVPLQKTKKTKRDAKREEMARRVQERATTARPEMVTSGESGDTQDRKVLNEIPLFEPIENEVERDEEEQVHLPTATQLRRRKEFGLFMPGLSGTESVILPANEPVQPGKLPGMSLLVSFELTEEEAVRPPTQPTAKNTTQMSSLPQDLGPPARNPGHSVRSPIPTPATIAAQPPDTTRSTATAIGKRKKSSNYSKHFQPPKVIAKEVSRVEVGSKQGKGVSAPLSSSRSAPKWVTE